MKEPQKIPLTNNPRNREPIKIPLTTEHLNDFDTIDNVRIKINNEDNKQNDTQSVQKLDSD
jgi:hypothetical protein